MNSFDTMATISVNLTKSQITKLQRAVKDKTGTTLNITKARMQGEHVLPVTATMLAQYNRALAAGRGVTLTFSKTLMQKLKSGGFLGSLIPMLAPMVMPVVQSLVSGIFGSPKEGSGTSMDGPTVAFNPTKAQTGALINALENNTGLKLTITADQMDIQGELELPVTPAMMRRWEKALNAGRGITLTFSKTLLSKLKTGGDIMVHLFNLLMRLLGQHESFSGGDARPGDLMQFGSGEGEGLRNFGSGTGEGLRNFGETVGRGPGYLKKKLPHITMID